MRSPELDLASCLARVARGDSQAARELVQHCHPLVEKLVRAHHAREMSDDDLVQEVFAKMFARLDRYSPRAEIPFEHWLARLTVNTCRDALRSEARRSNALPMSSGAHAWLESLSCEHSNAAHGDLAARELVQALLAELPPADRLVLTLLDLDRRSVAEVAALTGWSRTLVKVRAFRARLRLKQVAQRRGARDD